jgi:rRNA maturation endonuclease Nob1
MKEYRILCEECDNETHLAVEDNVDIEFCPCCGRRTEPEDITETDI